jgi:DHA1 family bicyclomycin/chloramphenicol resistance-like MFS transporter
MAMVRDTQQGDQMARTMSLAMAIYLIVPILAPSLGEALLAFSPWRIVFWVPAAVAVGVLVWMIRRLPETLPVEKRRSVSPRALASAMGQVLRTRQTASLGLAVAFLFGAMTSFVGSSELLIDDVFGRPEIFALMFGIVGCLLGIGALLNARLVTRLGVDRLLRVGSLYVVAAALAMFAVSRLNGGVPPLWLFWTSIALFMPGVSMLIPNCNTAAMVPLPHVAGMASAALGAVSTAGGAFLGSIADGAFDGTVRPFAMFALGYAVLGSLSINVLAGRMRALRPATAGAAAAAATPPAA